MEFARVDSYPAQGTWLRANSGQGEETGPEGAAHSTTRIRRVRIRPSWPLEGPRLRASNARRVTGLAWRWANDAADGGGREVRGCW